jgi:hypothetical protein
MEIDRQAHILDDIIGSGAYTETSMWDAVALCPRAVRHPREQPSSKSQLTLDPFAVKAY